VPEGNMNRPNINKTLIPLVLIIVIVISSTLLVYYQGQNYYSETQQVSQSINEYFNLEVNHNKHYVRSAEELAVIVSIENITDNELNFISISEIFTYTITKNSSEKSESESTLELVNFKLSPEGKIQKVYTPIFPYFIDLSNEPNSNYNPFFLEHGLYSVLVNYSFNLDPDTVVTDSVPFSYEIVSPIKRILINMYDIIFQ
jgi:hypothetical protein